jgi:hypothetical protein
MAGLSRSIPSPVSSPDFGSFADKVIGNRTLRRRSPLGKRRCLTYIGTTTIMPFLPGAWAQEAGGFPIFTLPMGFLMKDVLFLAASFYLLKQDLVRAAMEIRPGSMPDRRV